MNRNKTAKAGASFKVLALIASLSMILAGFAAGLMASPASAKERPKYEHSSPEHNDENKCKDDGGDWVEDASSTSVEPSIDSVDVAVPKTYHCDDSDQENCETQVSPSSSHEWVKDSDSHEWGCEPKDPPVCDDAALTSGTSDDCDNPCDNNVQAAEDNGSEGDNCDNPCDSVLVGSVNGGQGDDDGCEPTPVEAASLTCKDGWTASLSGYKPGTKVRIQLDGTTVIESIVDGEGDYNGSGPTNLADGTHTLTVQVATSDDENEDSEEVDSVVYRDENKEPTDDPSAPSDEEETYTTVKTAEAICTTPTPPCTENCTPACTVDCNPVVTVDPPVETPVVVAAATVEAPVAVSAPAPATVAAPAPATVAVPAAATLPASVPAGDGSQAPGLPMWALAMIAVGVLGAGFAGKSILAARK